MLRQAAALKDHLASAVVTDIEMHNSNAFLMTFQYYNYSFKKL